MRRGLIVLGAAIASVGVAALLFLAGGESERAGRSPRRPAVTCSPLGLDSPLGEDWDHAIRGGGAALLPGDVLRYRFRVATRPAGARTAAVGTTGEMVVRIYGTAERGWVVGFEVTGLAPEAPSDPAPPMGVAEATARIARDGAITDFAASPSTAIQDERFLKELVSRLFATTPDDTAAESWEGDEDDGLCLVRARYRRLSPPDRWPREVDKTRQGRAEIEGDVIEVTGRALMLLDPLVQRVSGLDRRRVVRDGRTLADEETEYRFDLVEEGRESPARLIEEHRARQPQITIQVQEGSAEAARDEARARVAALLRSPPEDASDFARELLDALWRDPGAASLVLARVREPACGDRETAVLLSVLAEASVPEAEATILGALETAMTGERTKGALHALSCLRAPSSAVDDALRAGMGGAWGAEAAKAYGIVANRVRHADPDRHARATSILDARLREAKGDGRLDAIAALGLVVPAAVPPSLRAAAADESEDVRVAAQWALARVPGVEAAAILRAAALQDPAPDARRAAIQAFEIRSQSGLTADLTELLAEVVAADPSAEIRELASAMLERMGPRDGR